MKRVKMKQTIMGNNPQCLTTSKKSEKSDGNDLFSLLPLDLKVEILEKLPAKSIAKFIFVSKFWSSTIRGKDFTQLYLPRSSTQPRLFCIAFHHRTQVFHSCTQEDPFSDHYITHNPDYLFEFSPPVRGLICCRTATKVVICNPSTGQLVALPRVKSRRIGVLSFLGYEPVNDVYKVLSMTVKNVHQKHGSLDVAEEHQVFTLGAQNAEWRMIECKHPHLPLKTKVLCRNGVLYYYAWINIEGSLISFDLRSEDFNVIKLPEDVRLLKYSNLVNYKGNIALTSELFNGTLDLRVLEDATKQEWSKVSVSILSWGDLVGDNIFSFRGALSNGELIFALRSSTKPFYILCYDSKVNNARKVVIEEIGDDFQCVQVFMDHIDSPMILPNIS